MKNLSKYLPVAVPATFAIIAALAIFMFVRSRETSHSVQVNPTPTNKGLDSSSLESTLLQLERGGTVFERVDAARIFGSQPPAPSSSIIQGLGRALMYDPDHRVRAAVAMSIAQSRRNCQPMERVCNEPQILEILLAAYQQEPDASVRREIVRAAGEFDHADAVTVINLALEDEDSSVRETALLVKNLREQRLLRARTG